MMSLMIKKSSKSSQNSLNDMTLNEEIGYTVTNSAYTQARAKLNYTAFIELNEKSVEMFYEDGEYNRYKKFRLLAVDGSVVILPNSDDIKREFNPTLAKCQIPGYEKEVVQARVSTLYDVMNNLALDAMIKNKVRLICQPYIILITKHSKQLFPSVASFFLQTLQVISYYLNYAFFVDCNRLQCI